MNEKNKSQEMDTVWRSVQWNGKICERKDIQEIKRKQFNRKKWVSYEQSNICFVFM